jgi:hypothetical protein
MGLRQIEVKTNYGELIDDYKTHNAFAFSNRHLDSRIRYDSSEPFLEMVIKPTNDLDLYVRNYMTLLDVLGNLGGLTGVFMFVILLFYTGYNAYF